MEYDIALSVNELKGFDYVRIKAVFLWYATYAKNLRGMNSIFVLSRQWSHLKFKGRMP